MNSIVKNANLTMDYKYYKVKIKYISKLCEIFFLFNHCPERRGEGAKNTLLQKLMIDLSIIVNMIAYIDA